MKHAFARIAVLSAVVLCACPPARPNLPQAQCEADSQCDPGKRCGPSGRCVDACAADRDCVSPQTCQSGACVAPAGQCALDSDCTASQVCALHTCARRCVAAAECEAGQNCVSGACLEVSTKCTVAADCPSGQSCVAGRCSQSCQTANDCAAGNQCMGGFCVASSMPACIHAADCSSGQACGPSGQCVKECTTVAQCAATGEACSNGACVSVGPNTSTITGRAVMASVADLSGLEVTLRGPYRWTGVTATDGTFSFEGLSPGQYTVTVTAPYSIEGAASKDVAVTGGMTASAGDITLTPAGRVEGNVTLSGKTSHEGIQVVAVGTSQGTVTAADGGFALTLAAGTYDLLASAPGYLSAQIPQVSVSYHTTTTAPSLVLNHVPSGSIFAFSSIPPTTARVDRSFLYQAIAGGGGVSTVTYGLAAGPAAMTINSTTGQVSWMTPTLGRSFVGVSANGDGNLIYQVFSIDVTPGTQTVISKRVLKMRDTDGGFWALHDDGASLVADDGGFTTFAATSALSGTVGTWELLNGATISSAAWPGGTVSGVRTSSGALAATWEGGTVATVTGLDSRTVASRALAGGTISGVAGQEPDLISAVSFPSGTITAVSDGRSRATSIDTQTGVISGLTASVLTDAAANYPASALNTWCVGDLAGTVRSTITANTSTTITVATGVDLTTLLSVGDRYFVVRCSDGQAIFTLTDTTASFGSLVSRAADLYTSSVALGRFDVISTPPSTATSFSFMAPPTRWASLQASAASGFYALGSTSTNTVDLALTDPTAAFPPNLSFTNYLSFDDFVTYYAIAANTATTVTARVSFGSLLTNRLGRKWVLLDFSARVPVTVTLTTGGLTPSAQINRGLWVDVTGIGFPIIANTANTVTAAVSLNALPPIGWVGSDSSLMAAYYDRPGLRIRTTGLTAGALVGRDLMTLTNGNTTPFTSEGTIIWNSGTEAQLAENYCGNCANYLSLARARLIGQTWVPGRSTPSRGVDFRVVLSGSPGFAPDALVGRTVVPAQSPIASGVIVSNSADTLTVSVDEASFAAFQALLAGSQLWLSDPLSGSVTPLRVRLTASGASWTTDQWLNDTVVANNGRVAGRVTTNGASTLDFAATDSSALGALVAGAPFAFGFAYPQGVGCSGVSQWIRTTAALTGATLAASSYTHLRLSNTSTLFPVISNSTGSAQLLVCASDFIRFVSGQGQPAALVRNGLLDLTLDVSNPTWTGSPNGQRVQLLGPTGQWLRDPISSSTASSLTIGSIDVNTWFSSYNSARVASGLDFALTNASQETPVTLTTAGGLTANALAGQQLRLNDGQTNTGAVPYVALGNTATTVTLDRVPSTALDIFRAIGAARLQYLSTSQGSVVRLTDLSQSWAPNALAGRFFRLNSGWTYEVLANTATQVTGVASATEAFADDSLATSYSFSVEGFTGPMAVLTNGDLMAGLFSASSEGLVRFTAGGVSQRLTPVASSRLLTVSEAPLTTGTFQNPPVSDFNLQTTTWTESQWTFNQNELAGSYLRTRDNCTSSNLTRLWPILSNGASSITVLGTISCAANQAGAAYAIVPGKLNVSGTALTASELKGRTVRLNGNDYVVRDNTASQLQLWLPDTLATSRPAPLVEPGGTARVFTGLDTDQLVGAASDEQGGLWVATPSRVSHFDGSGWQHYGFEQTATVRRTGAISSVYSSYQLSDSGAAFTPNELVGRLVSFSGRRLFIGSNTRNDIQISGSFNLQYPVPGDAYTVYEDDGLSGITGLDFNGGVLWVSTSRGLFRRAANGTWSRLTVASTESMAGRGDGLPFDALRGLRALGPNEVYVLPTSANGAARFDGSTWTRYTVALTESMPGKHDGLANDSVTEFYRESGGATWFLTSFGASQLSGSTWTTVGQTEGYSGASGLHVTPIGDRFFGTATSLIRPLP